MEDKIVLYTVNCPKCKVLEMKLRQKNIDFKTVSDADKVVEIGKQHGISSAPIMQIDSDYLDFSQAIKYVNGR
jgi:hypothetical protein